MAAQVGIRDRAIRSRDMMESVERVKVSPEKEQYGGERQLVPMLVMPSQYASTRKAYF